MDRRKDVALRLQGLDAMRQAVQTVDGALQVLTPEERLVAQMLLISPQRGNVQRLCEMLCVEKSSVYRRRERVLEKLERVLFGGSD